MSDASTPATTDRRVAEGRELFLSAPERGTEAVRGLVRDPIVSSWQRSYAEQVDATHIELSRREPDFDSPLVRAAAPVIADVRETLHQDAASLILTDAHGNVLLRECSDDQLARHLDQVQLATGYSYQEGCVGTNGIGTALESLAPTLVYGHEHYAEELVRLACGGVPVRDPVRGTVLGLLDVTTWATVPSGLLLTLARSTAYRIEQNLLTHSDRTEQALLAQYLKTCQHTGGAVFAVGEEIMMMNERARRSLDPGDQTVLLTQARDAIGSNSSSSRVVDLPSGSSARMHSQPAFNDTVPAGCVVHVHTARTPPTTTPATAERHRHLTGLAGTSTAWLRCCRNVQSRHRSRETVLLRGEDGAGKTTLLRAVHRAQDPQGHLAVLWASESEDCEAWLDTVSNELDVTGGTLVLARLDRIHPGAVDGLGELLQQHSEERGSRSGPWVVATMGAEGTEQQDTGIDAVLLPHFMHTIEVPALRHHIDDLPDLVGSLLSALDNHNRVSLAPDAMRQLMLAPWPGNVSQLRQVLLRLLQHHRTGTVTADELPPECRSLCRGQLSAIEALERDAIVNSLVSNGGDKTATAQELGMSRATVYRRLRRYGITL